MNKKNLSLVDEKKMYTYTLRFIQVYSIMTIIANTTLQCQRLYSGGGGGRSLLSIEILGPKYKILPFPLSQKKNKKESLYKDNVRL